MVSGLCRQWSKNVQDKIPWVVLKIISDIWNWNEWPNNEISYPYNDCLYIFTDNPKDDRAFSLVRIESLDY